MAGARMCPNLLQRRLGPGSAARRSAEYQRFSSRTPMESRPLQQIWTTGATADLSGAAGVAPPDRKIIHRAVMRVRGGGTAPPSPSSSPLTPTPSPSPTTSPGRVRGTDANERTRASRRPRAGADPAKILDDGIDGLKPTSGPARTRPGLRNASPARRSPPRLAPCKPSATKSGCARSARSHLAQCEPIAKIQRDDFRSRYLNFFEVTKDSNASQVFSKNALCLLLMEFLPSFQTFSMGFLSGL